MKLYMEENKRIKVTDYFMNKVRKSYKTKWGTIVGGYEASVHSPYVYIAYHVQFDDGTQDTVWAKNNKLVSNGYYG